MGAKGWRRRRGDWEFIRYLLHTTTTTMRSKTLSCNRWERPHLLQVVGDGPAAVSWDLGQNDDQRDTTNSSRPGLVPAGCDGRERPANRPRAAHAYPPERMNRTLRTRPMPMKMSETCSIRELAARRPRARAMSAR